ncbi:MAG TPA: hypothetical protein VL098_02790 [Flavipsychrobacter sp.]|nr:hypothetical protein [Flavipsychrobacter sp.]
MKRFLVIPLLFLYMVATSGVIVHLHYCGEEVASWALNNSGDGCEDDLCGEGTKKETGCCKDKVVTSKLSVEQLAIAQFKLNFTQRFVLPDNPFYFIDHSCPDFSEIREFTYQANAPPGNWQFTPLYKLYSSLTYYG